MSYCGELTSVKRTKHGYSAASLRCNSWTCPDCAPARKRRLIAQAHRGKADTFVTLTARRGEFSSPDMAAKRLARAWKLIHKRALREAKRDPSAKPIPFGAAPKDGWPEGKTVTIPNKVRLHGDRLEYLCVIEAHKSGWPHLHILLRSKWIDQKWLSAQCDDILGSPVVDVRRVTKQSQVNAYVAKYATKCEHKFGTTKRYWQSKRYELTRYEKRAANDNDTLAAFIVAKPLHRILAQWQSEGWDITATSAWHLSAKPPWDG